MKWEDIQRKLTSRKFWLAIGSFVSMLIVALGGAEETATQVSALIMAGATVVAYIIGEGMADAANAGGVIEIVGDEGKQDDHSGDGE